MKPGNVFLQHSRRLPAFVGRKHTPLPEKEIPFEKSHMRSHDRNEISSVTRQQSLPRRNSIEKISHRHYPNFLPEGKMLREHDLVVAEIELGIASVSYR